MKTLSDKPLNLDPINNGAQIETINFYSETMQDLYRKIVAVANTNKTVILTGEQGAGKRYVAKLMHSLSPYSEDSFRDIFCNTLEETIQDIVEREKERSPQEANYHQDKENFVLDFLSGGTLFFNAFSELSHFNKRILLNILNSAQKMHSRSSIHNNFRFFLSIEESEYSKFKEKSFWTRLLKLLDPTIINIPPLREHCEDITLLIDRFLLDFAAKNNAQVHAIAPRAVYKCISYHWPGNIRQLKNTIEHAATIVPAGSVITANHLPFSLDWKSPYQLNDMDIKHDKSFARAEKMLLKELISNPDISEQEFENMDQEYNIPFRNRLIFLS
ncbi:MAG: sigma 54-interacting transcriptional regulator [Balneolaceae bacterium]|nr:sigma 54-interacting transcriptional regulator [Balneolaceae bacterium]